MERYDFEVMRGATFSRALCLKKNGVPLDLTGWTGKAQVRTEPESPTLTCEMTLEVEPVEGKVRMVIPAEVTGKIPMGFYAWDIRLTDSGGTVRYYLGGVFKVLPTVTR
ncbi:MAG: hypothetical protein IJI41_09800 [Anaerolineaceae bacterium]|nr:hypothetical protein [Anaerolineaceae bacterium]